MTGSSGQHYRSRRPDHLAGVNRPDTDSGDSGSAKKDSANAISAPEIADLTSGKKKPQKKKRSSLFDLGLRKQDADVDGRNLFIDRNGLNDEEEEEEQQPPRLPKGRKLLDTLVGIDVDSLFRSVFDNDNFFEIVCSKSYEELRDFACTPWTRSRASGLLERRMSYQIVKWIALSRQNVLVEQTQAKAAYCRRGLVYGVDTVTRNSGVMYADYFIIHIHYRLTAEGMDRSRMVVVAEIEFLKPCLFRGRIESEAWSGMKKYYDLVDKEVQLERDLHEERDEDSKTLTRDLGDVTAATALIKAGGGVARLVSSTTAPSQTKYLKESLSRRRLSHRTGQTHMGKNDVQVVHRLGAVNDRRSGVNGLMIFSLVVLVLSLLLLTVAMFMMNSALNSMHERMNHLYEMAEMNQALLQQVNVDQRPL